MIAIRTICLGAAFVAAGATMHAGILRQGKTLLLCHRTANRDVPENSLESLTLAARMGCDIIEVDVTRTLDGYLVLNHDNFLDRFTNTTGEVEHTDLWELDRMDFGAWQGKRFRGIRIAHFDEALRRARQLNVALYLDIKSKGIGRSVLDAVAREGMLDRVIFGGEWDDVKALDPHANPDGVADLKPESTSEDVERMHREGKAVIANFILNGHQTDLPAMRAAVAHGVDGIMVDYPRLGAEALGRPVEERLSRLSMQAESGGTSQRIAAIRELSDFIGFPLQSRLLHWMEDTDETVSHEAALALLASRQPVTFAALDAMTHSSKANARRNGAWLIGSLSAERSDRDDCVSLLSPMLDDPDQSVVKEALLAITWCPSASASAVSAEKLLALLHNRVPVIRGLAAVALAKFHPDLAAGPIREQLRNEESEAVAYDAAWAARGREKLTQSEIDELVEKYRAQMKYVQAISTLPDQAAFPLLVEQAFRPVHDYSNAVAVVAAYQLWDRLAAHPQPAIEALASNDNDVADRAQWALIEAGPKVLPAVRGALRNAPEPVVKRLIAILAYEADSDAIPALLALEQSDPNNNELVHWAIDKIENADSYLKRTY